MIRVSALSKSESVELVSMVASDELKVWLQKHCPCVKKSRRRHTCHHQSDSGRSDGGDKAGYQLLSWLRNCRDAGGALAQIEGVILLSEPGSVTKRP